jgi:hypothetical protein
MLPPWVREPARPGRRLDGRAGGRHPHGGAHHRILRAHAIAAGGATPDRVGMRWKIVVPLALVAVVAVVALAVAGGDSKEEKALAQVCGARADIAEQVSTLRGLTPATAKDQISQSVRAIADDLSSIAGARGDLAAEHRDQVQTANADFAKTVKDTLGSVTDLATLQTAPGTVQKAAQQLGATYQSTFAKIDCGES